MIQWHSIEFGAAIAKQWRLAGCEDDIVVSIVADCSEANEVVFRLSLASPSFS